MDWKNHPLVAASIASASTAAFCITVIVPIYEKNNLNSIAEYEKKLSLLKTEIDQRNISIEKLSKETKELHKNIELKNQETLKLREEDRFSSETPLPKGFRSAVPFAPYDTLKDAYKNPPKTLNKHYTSYSIDDTLFASVAYYPMNCKDKIRISHIFFQFKDAYDIYLEERKKEKDEKIIMPPSPIESSTFDKNIKTATLQIFREKYGEEFATDEDSHYFSVNNLWTASISDVGLVVYTALGEEEIKKICNDPKNKK